MSYGVYIGPFLRCEGGKDVEVSEILDDRLADERGELSCDDAGVRYIAPNVEYGITRQERFGRHDEAPVVMSIDQAAEMDAFRSYFAGDIETLSPLFDSITVEWGVVPSYS
jgi:hypothetical protein